MHELQRAAWKKFEDAGFASWQLFVEVGEGPCNAHQVLNTLNTGRPSLQEADRRCEGRPRLSAERPAGVEPREAGSWVFAASSSLQAERLSAQPHQKRLVDPGQQMSTRFGTATQV